MKKSENVASKMISPDVDYSTSALLRFQNQSERATLRLKKKRHKKKFKLRGCFALTHPTQVGVCGADRTRIATPVEELRVHPPQKKCKKEKKRCTPHTSGDLWCRRSTHRHLRPRTPRLHTRFAHMSNHHQAHELETKRFEMRPAQVTQKLRNCTRRRQHPLGTKHAQEKHPQPEEQVTLALLAGLVRP